MAWIRSLLSTKEQASLVEQIGLAERGHRGELRVHVEPRYPGDGPVERARALYHQLGVGQTQGDTGALLYVAWEDHKSAVWVGAGVDLRDRRAACQRVVDTVAFHARRGDAYAGLSSAIGQLGVLLSLGAPGEDTAGNELANDLSIGGSA